MIPDRIQIHDLFFRKYIPTKIIFARLEELALEIRFQYRNAEKPPLFVGILNGSVVFMSDLLRACAPLMCETAFVRLASYSGTQSTGEVRTILDLDIPIAGRDVIVVEDIIDTGNTLHFFLEQLQARGPASLRVAALLFKPEALVHKDIPQDFIGFDIPNDFVVGYGLDYNGLGRNLPDIYVLAK
jgi:hypoxanthine phosphoribosyltransferase